MIDFGISKRIKYSEEICLTPVGHPKYKSPEILKQDPYNKEVDLWNCGQVFIELITHKLYSTEKLVKTIKNQKLLPILEKNLKELIPCQD